VPRTSLELSAAKGYSLTVLRAAVLRRVLETADVQRMPCYLETVQAPNVPFYERLGFVVVRHGVEHTSGLSYWTFRRVPR
jgi:hypothetical protein